MTSLLWFSSILYIVLRSCGSIDVVTQPNQMPLDRCNGEIVNCYIPPCASTEMKCPGYPDAICIDDYCNGCNARFFNKDDIKYENELDCGHKSETTESADTKLKESEAATADIEDDESECITAGCSGELCVPKDATATDTICELKCENGCTRFLLCGEDPLGKCAWITKPEQTKEYLDCLSQCAASNPKIQRITEELEDIKMKDPDPRLMCICTADYNPICCDGKQYSNPCNAECDGISKPARDQEYCTMGECDKVKEGNEEEKEMETEQKKEVAKEGKKEHEKKCACQKIYKPVCCNGVTYSNECMAVCHGISSPVYAQSECNRGACKHDL